MPVRRITRQKTGQLRRRRRAFTAPTDFTIAPTIGTLTLTADAPTVTVTGGSNVALRRKQRRPKPQSKLPRRLQTLRRRRRVPASIQFVELTPTIGVLTLTADAPTVTVTDVSSLAAQQEFRKRRKRRRIVRRSRLAYLRQRRSAPSFPAADVTVSPTIGTLTLTADAPTVTTTGVGTLVALETRRRRKRKLPVRRSRLAALRRRRSAPTFPAANVDVAPTIGVLTLTADAPTVTTTGVGTLVALETRKRRKRKPKPYRSRLRYLRKRRVTPGAFPAPIIVAPTIGVLTLTADAPTFTVTASPTIGTLTLNANAPTVTLTYNPTIGVLTLTGDAPTVTGGAAPAQTTVPQDLTFYIVTI